DRGAGLLHRADRLVHAADPGAHDRPRLARDQPRDGRLRWARACLAPTPSRPPTLGRAPGGRRRGSWPRFRGCSSRSRFEGSTSGRQAEMGAGLPGTDAASTADAWPRTRRPMPWFLAAFLVMIFLAPCEAIHLDVPLPVSSDLDRFFVAALVAAFALCALLG